MLTAKQPAGIASHSFSKNPHIPSFHIQGGERGDAEEVWARLAASQRPQDANIFKEKPIVLQGHVKARWPCSEAAPKGQEGSSSPSCGGGGGSGKTRQRHVS